MPNINNNTSFTDGDLSLARVYGLDDTNDRSGQHLNDLAGYNLNQNQSQNQDQTKNHTQTQSQTQTQTQTQTSTNTRHDIPQQNTSSSIGDQMPQQQPSSFDVPTNGMMQMPPVSSENNFQQGMLNIRDDISRQNGQRINQLIPQRQEQTLPSARGSQENNMMMCSDNQNNQFPVNTSEDMNSFLSSQTGKNVSIQFLIGTNTLVEKSGVLLSVGSNYIIIRENESDDILVCDFDNVKFVRFDETDN